MSRLQLPLLHRILWTTGDVLLRAEVTLALKTNKGTWEEVTFLVDSGSEMTTMPAPEARNLDLPMPAFASPGANHRQTSLAIRPGFLRARVVGLDATEYGFPCFFLGDPNVVYPTGRAVSTPRTLLGRSERVDKLRMIFDGKPAVGASYGSLTLEKK